MLHDVTWYSRVEASTFGGTAAVQLEPSTVHATGFPEAPYAILDYRCVVVFGRLPYRRVPGMRSPDATKYSDNLTGAQAHNCWSLLQTPLKEQSGLAGASPHKPEVLCHHGLRNLSSFHRSGCTARLHCTNNAEPGSHRAQASRPGVAFNGLCSQTKRISVMPSMDLSRLCNART